VQLGELVHVQRPEWGSEQVPSIVAHFAAQSPKEGRRKIGGRFAFPCWMGFVADARLCLSVALGCIFAPTSSRAACFAFRWPIPEPELQIFLRAFPLSMHQGVCGGIGLHFGSVATV